MCLNCALYFKAMKKWCETTGHTLDIGVYMERGNKKEYKEKQEEFAVTIDNACTIYCAKQSHVLRYFSYWLTGFLAKCVKDEEHYAKVALS